MSRTAWMRQAASFLTLRRIFLALGALAVVLLIWFGGPLVALADWKPLASVAARSIFLLLLVVGLMAHYLWRAKQEESANEKVVNEMMAGSREDDLLKEEANTQRDRMRQALALVRKWQPGRFRSVYELPWYMIIGAPGSGKSTALLNSGLEFPLKEEMGIDSVKGVGGTRYCDWWFTNRAVIIDTAGRYTTQESTDRRDARGWNSFLGLLKKYRSRQPINGVILSISVADLLELTPTEQMLHARAMKQRVQELKNRLGVVFPVYVMLTKFDLLEGFSDTFGMLSEQERQEVCGITFELQSVRDPKTLPAAFDGEFDALLERLSQFLLHRLQQERTPATQRRIYQFPKQVALLRAPLWNLLKEVFFPSAYEEIPLLRGIYLVSSEQGGASHDKVSDLVDDQFKLKVPAQGMRSSTLSRDGFFLKHLFENIVFSEHGLASADMRKEKHFVWARRAALAGIVGVSLGLGAAWYLSYQWNAGLVAAYQSGLGELEAELKHPRQNWVRLDGLLSKAVAMPGVMGTPMPEGGPRQLGLFQGDALAQAAVGAYGRLLQYRFGGALKEALEVEISGNLANLEYLYETLKTYLMLNDRQHLDKAQVRAWFEFILMRQLPGKINAPSRQSLMEHLDSYLALDHSLPLDTALVATARAELTSMPLAERAYQRIKMDAALSRLPEFRLSMVLGSVAELVFERRSGASLQEGIPGLFTLNGYQGIFEPEKNKIVGNLLEDSWVYGEEVADFRDLDEQHIKEGVKARYYRDYVHAWQTFLADLRVQPFRSHQEGMRIANLLAGPEAPLQRLIRAVKHNTDLTRETVQGAALDEAASAATEGLSRRREFQALMGMAPARIGPEPTPVDQTFKTLHQLNDDVFHALQADAKIMARYFEEQSGARPQALATVSREQFNEAVKGFYSTATDTESKAFQKMLEGFATDSRRLVKVSVTKKVNDIWRSRVYSDYRRAIEGNYPFDSEAETDVALADFANFFGYGGTLDRFFQRHIKPHVNTSRSPWRLKSDIGIDQRSLKLFEKAQRIREAFFEPGSREPHVAFSLEPVYLDSRVTQLMLEINGQSLVYRHGPPRTIGFEWPEEAGAQLTRIALTVSQASSPVQASYQGAWSVFRMLQAAGGMTSDARHQMVDIQLENYLASLELTTSSVKHPFTTALLERFQLPRTL